MDRRVCALRSTRTAGIPREISDYISRLDAQAANTGSEAVSVKSNLIRDSTALNFEDSDPVSRWDRASRRLFRRRFGFNNRLAVSDEDLGRRGDFDARTGCRRGDHRYRNRDIYDSRGRMYRCTCAC